MDKTYLLFILATLVATLTLENFFQCFIIKPVCELQLAEGSALLEARRVG